MPPIYNVLFEQETGRTVVPRIERATSLWQHTVGLLGRTSLAPDSGFWIEPCNSVHTFGMRFPIDILFLDCSGKPLHWQANLPPWRIAGPVRGARTVVELPSGALAIMRLNRDHHYILR